MSGMNGHRIDVGIVARRRVGRNFTPEQAAAIDAEWGKRLYRSMRAAFRAGVTAHRETCGGTLLPVACTDEAISGWLQRQSEADDKRVEQGGINDPQFC